MCHYTTVRNVQHVLTHFSFWATLSQFVVEVGPR